MYSRVNVNNIVYYSRSSSVPIIMLLHDNTLTCFHCTRCPVHSEGVGETGRPSLLPHHLHCPRHVLLLSGGDAAVQRYTPWRLLHLL